MSDLYTRLRAALPPERLSAYCPHLPTPQQRKFLDLPDEEAFYGGAAGGGKSDALLMAALQYVHVPEYRALLLRRTRQELLLPDALMDRARRWLSPHKELVWRAETSSWKFPSGAEIIFGYCDDPGDELRYQSAAFHFIGIDEVGQWLEGPYRYLFSRIRKAKDSPIPERMRSAGNPGGVGHPWVYARFVNPKTAVAKFVPAKLTDNPHLDTAGYLKMLAKLDRTTRDQLEKGLWILDSEGRVYRYDRERNSAKGEPEGPGWNLILGVDLGASERKATTAFAIVAWHKHHPEAYIIRSWAKAGMTPSTCAEEVQMVLEQFPETRVVMDEGALGRGYASEMRTRYQIPVTSAQKRDKLGFRKLMNGEFEGLRLFVVAGQNEALEDEYETLVWDKSGMDVHPSLDDHLSDAALYAWREARSFTSTAAPDKRPKPYSVEWYLEREAKSLEAERAACLSEPTDPWETW